MSHLDVRFERRYSAVGTTLGQLSAMLALDERDRTARALCVELALTGGSRRNGEWCDDRAGYRPG
jgi:hypothetical protein